MPHDTTALRVGSVLFSGGTGFVFGWLFSGRAKIFRAFLLGGAAGIATIATVADHGVMVWASASTLSIGCFLAGLGYWLGRAAKRFMSIPTTFRSSRWADLSDVIGNTPPSLGHRYPWFQDDALKDLGRNLRDSA